jgi:hypothetical protein
VAYRIDFSRDLAQERKRIAAEQIARARAELGDPALDIDTCVHQFRKRMKKIRALLWLYRAADSKWYRREDRRYRDLARTCSRQRDATVAVETLERVTDYFARQIEPGGFLSIRAELDARRRAYSQRALRDTSLAQLGKSLQRLQRRVADWPEPHIDIDTLVNGIRKTHRRTYQMMYRARDHNSAQTWHEWRKCVKYLNYHWKLLRGAWPPVIKVWRAELGRLGGLLGADHDFMQLAGQLDCNERAAAALHGLLIELGKHNRTAAQSLGAHLLSDAGASTERGLQLLLAAASNR